MGSRASVSAGSLLAGRYRLVEPLPDAAVGTWRARDDMSDRDVAARKLPLGPGEVPDAVRQRALHEVRDAARLRHAGIVAVYDVVEHDGVLWVVTELVRAPSLDHVLRTRGPVPPVEAARIGLRVLEALEVADAAGVRHRDLTPASVLVGGDGRVAVAGFGLTPEVEQSPGRPAAVTGSVDFVAPERARGIPTGGIESDLWSLGATLYAVVEGRMPFHRDAALATLTAVVTDEPPPPRRAGPLRPVLDGLLIKDPAHRLGVADVRRMLDGVVRGVPVVAPPRRTSSEAAPVPRSAAQAETGGRPAVGAPAAPAAAVGGAASATAGALESASPAAPGGQPAHAGATTMAGDGPTAERIGADEPVGAGTAAGEAGAATARPASGAAAAGTARTGSSGTSGGGTDVAAAGPPARGTAGTSAAGAGPDRAGTSGAGAEAAGRMTGAKAAGWLGEARGEAGAPVAGAPGEPDSTAADDDVEIHDPGVAAALAAFEAALGPVIPQPRPPAAAGSDPPASPAVVRSEAPASPATGPEAPASPAAGLEAPASPAAGRDGSASSAAARPGVPASSATGPDAPPSPADAGPDHAPTSPDLPSREAAGTRRADDAPKFPLAASKPPTRPTPLPRTTFPAPPVRPLNGRPPAALPALPSVIGSAPPADPATRNGRTPPQVRPAPPARPGPTPFPTPSRPRIDELAGGGSGSRRRSVLTVLAVALALVAAVLIPFAVDRARDDAAGSPPPAGPSPASRTDPASSSPSPEAAAPPPAGFRLHRDRTGFSIAVPSGWREERDGTIVDFRDPTSSRFIRIDQRADPRTDPYDDWIGLEPTYKRRLPGYDLLRIANVQYRGWRTADWEFTWGAPGSERSHVRIRNVVPNQHHGYALYWSTTDSDWTKDLPYFDIFVRTFAPSAGR